MATLKKITPNLAVLDVRAAVRFYGEVLGFKLLMAVPVTQDGVDSQLEDGKEYVYALVARDGVEFMFQSKDTLEHDISFFADRADIRASAVFYMEVEDIEAVYQEIREKHKDVKTTELRTTWYGMREFYLEDNSGYVLGFAELAKK